MNPMFIKSRGGCELNENEFDNLVKFAEQKGFPITSLEALLWTGEELWNSRVLKIGHCVNDSSHIRIPYYIAFGQQMDVVLCKYEKIETYRLNDMKPWDEVLKEKFYASK